MSDSMANPAASLIKPLLAFCGALIFAQIVLIVILSFVDLPTSGSGVSMAILVVSGMTAGQVFAHSARRLMTKGERFRFAIFATILGYLIAAVGFYATFVYYDVPFTIDNLLAALGVPADNAAMFFSVVIGVASVLSLIVLYFASGFGAKTALKQLEKQGKL